MNPITLANDRSFDIAFGRNRKETNWKNRELLWSDFVNRVSITHRTAETYSEYITARKPRQDEIKDVGGFVGGYITGGRRKVNSVLHRSIITLDVDHGNLDFWKAFVLMYDCTAVMYSTHKHSPQTPRYRLVILLSRPVKPDEYEAIARKVAGNIDIEVFDPTTFQSERLMYWPSTSMDGEYVFEYQDGPALNADEVLATYRDWQDSSEWPVSVKVDSILQRSMQRQGDPLEKTGLIGAWCRTYTIHEVIETHLSDVYEATADPNRYTYKEGSTAAGLIVYDDKYAYSHHGTDPISGKLCNAFDLVRIHKFGLKDEDAREGTPGNKLPSYVAMEDFCSKDTPTKRTLFNDRANAAKDDFAGLISTNADTDTTDTPAVEVDDSWKDKLDVDRKGNIYSTIGNCLLILREDHNLKGCFATDDFRARKVIRRRLPWRAITTDSQQLKDEDELNLLNYFESCYGILSRSNIKIAFDICIDENRFHPVKDYLTGLKWDGRPRVERLFIDYLGATDSEYIKAVTRKALVASVARIFKPGIKFDYVPTFIGPEGLGKSSLIAKLGGQWFTDSFNFHMLRNNQAYEQIQGFWLVEIAELTGLKSAEIEAAKQFITKQEDSYRPAYGRNVVTYKRQCVFFGSTNNREFLISQTGNRRFWPIEIMAQQPTKNVFKDLTQSEVAQVWAEAVKLYEAGEDLFLSAEMEATARLIQNEHTETDPRIGIVQQYLDTLLPDNWSEMNTSDRRTFLRDREFTQLEGTRQRDRVCAAEIWYECEAFEGYKVAINKQNTKEIHAIMRQIEGWGPYGAKVSFGNRYGQQKGYYRTKPGSKSVGATGQKNTNNRKSVGATGG